MTVIKYDENVNIHDLIEIGEAMHDRGYDVITIPSSVDLMVEATAEALFSIGDQIWVALEKIREERPEEYRKAYDNRLAIIRDKQWKKALDKANKKHKKKKCVCDECTVINCPDYDKNRKEKCEWFSKNPGGI
jgi:cobalamin biosynthesis Mg chelatase CobN